jgi:hypothetical protein
MLPKPADGVRAKAAGENMVTCVTCAREQEALWLLNPPVNVLSAVGKDLLANIWIAARFVMGLAGLMYYPVKTANQPSAAQTY